MHREDAELLVEEMRNFIWEIVDLKEKQMSDTDMRCLFESEVKRIRDTKEKIVNILVEMKQ